MNGTIRKTLMNNDWKVDDTSFQFHLAVNPEWDRPTRCHHVNRNAKRMTRLRGSAPFLSWRTQEYYEDNIRSRMVLVRVTVKCGPIPPLRITGG